MSRRTGQTGAVELRHGKWRGRYLIDIPGQFERKKVSLILGSPQDMTKSEARRKMKEIIMGLGINRPDYRIPSVETFEHRSEEWEQNYIKRMKPSNQALLRQVLKRYLLPKWKDVPVETITAGRVNQWIGEKEFEHLSPITIRGIVRTLQLALGVRFGRGSIHYPGRVDEEYETPVLHERRSCINTCLRPGSIQGPVLTGG